MATTREALPLRRNAVSFDVQHAFPGGGPQRWLATVGFYHDGRPGEVFVDAPKDLNIIGLLAREAAVLASIALQHGASVDELRAALVRDDDGAPHSVMGTVLDFITQSFCVQISEE